MKVLITTDLFTTATNGVVTSIQNLREELIKKGHEVRILTLSDRLSSHKAENVSYIRSIPLDVVYPDVRLPLSFRHAYIQEMIDWKPDVIHSQCEFFSFQFALRISKYTGAPIVHTYHTLYEQYATYLIPSKRLGKHVVRILSRKRLKNVDRVIAPTRKVEEALVSYGLQNEFSIIPSGISLKQHQRRITPEERARKREALGIAPDQMVLINLGRLGNEKNLEELISFFAEAIQQHHHLVFLIVGDGPARGDLTQQAHSLNLSERVIFTGMVNPSEVQDYYQLGDLFVSASTSETQGLTYIEAAANGLPLLCRKDPCLNDVLMPGENGYTYTNKQEFLKHLDEVLQNAAWRSAAKKRSEEIAASFDKSAFGDAIEAVYNDVLSVHETSEE